MENQVVMERFKKEKLVLEDRDSLTVTKLKGDCNNLIEKYTSLQSPLSDQGQQLAGQIHDYLLKINGLKDSNFDKMR